MAVARNQRKTENTAKRCKCVFLWVHAHTYVLRESTYTTTYIICLYIITNKYFSWYRNEAGKLRLQTALRSLSESGPKIHTLIILHIHILYIYNNYS